MKISAQQFANEIVAPRYRQPLKRAQEAVTWLRWENAHEPVCCGERVTVSNCLGEAYFAECKSCGRFMRNVLGPSFGNASIAFIDPNKVDVETDAVWIIGFDAKERA